MQIQDSVHPLFGSPLMISGEEYQLDEDELEYIRVQSKCLIGSNERSADTYILENESLSNLKHFLEHQTKVYVHDLLCITNDICITQSWINYNKHGENHHLHNHSNSIVSGVFYVKGDTPIRFHTFNTHWPLALDYSKSNFYNSEELIFNAKPGKVFLFPSTLFHSVDTNQSGDERISIAFNTFVKGSFGVESDLTRLEEKNIVSNNLTSDQ